MVFLVILINAGSFDAIVNLDKNYEEAWEYKGNCEK